MSKCTGADRRAGLLEISDGLLLHGRENLVGEAGDAEAEQVLVQPLLAKDGAYDRVIAHCIKGGRDAACSLESNLLAGCLKVLLNALAHHVCGLGRGVDLHLAGRGLDEIGTVFHCEEGGFGNEFRSNEKAGLEDDLQDYGAAQFGSYLVDAPTGSKDLCTGGFKVSGEEAVQGKDYVNFVGTAAHCQFNLVEFHLQEALGRGETAGYGSHMDVGVAAQGSDHVSKVGIHADGCGERV